MKDTIRALRDFRRAYTNLRFYWDRGPIKLNDTRALELYPFHESFDELDVYTWIDATLAEIKTLQPPRRDESGLSMKDIKMLKQIIRRERDNIGYLSEEEVDHLYKMLGYIDEIKELKEFLEYMDKACPDLPNDTPEAQAKFDAEWDKFYEMNFTISFGDRSIAIANEAALYNGIYETIKEILEDCR